MKLYGNMQIAFRDLEGSKDGLNKILSVDELKSFIPYEQLLEFVDKIEEEIYRYLIPHQIILKMVIGNILMM